MMSLINLLPLVQEDLSALKSNHLLSRGADFANVTTGYEEDEDDKEIRFSLDLPGVKANDLEVAVKENMLAISGARRYRSSNGSNSKKARFERSLMLDTDRVDVSKIKANLADGVLTVTVPKKPKAQPIKISVTTHSQEGRKEEEKEKVVVKAAKETDGKRVD